MVQTGTPEEYFGSPAKHVVIPQPIQAKVIEPIDIRYVYTQEPNADYTPLIICVCFLGTICFLAFLAWTWKK